MMDIRWTPLAVVSLDKTITYLEKNWTEREVKNFLRRLNSTISRIGKYPETSVPIKGKSFRRAIIDKNNSLVFKVLTDSIEILYVFDNRQNPIRVRTIIK